ncbi:MAG: bifunctional homocysteine S-methyltransferase/methylenetetrahydrofolate reductase [Lachnospiraceae bacterium]|nr:bifunctional homocysteine S-methyltransferase/methylenetetrahydrofolate reductase [Lachnospiraceae bacterium]
MNIKEYLAEKKLLCDGAFGTYFSEKRYAVQEFLSRDADVSENADLGMLIPEQANLLCPELVKQIHREYIEAGARLIRTNTFASNTLTLVCSAKKQQENIRAAVRLAREAVQESGQEVFLAGDIGPVDRLQDHAADRQRETEEYVRLVQTLLEEGVDILVFETFSDYEVILDVLKQVFSTSGNAGKKNMKKDDIFVIVQFSVNQHGYTAAGISAKRILDELADCPLVDAIGFNCGVGPGHMCQILGELNLPEGKFVTALPNASYPRLQQDRVVFLENQGYFAEKMTEMSDLGIDILGGCCGTNPSYIRRTAAAVNWQQRPRRLKRMKSRTIETASAKNSAFYAQKAPDEKLLAVEIAPPFHADDEKILDASHYLAAHQADVVTFPDSPSGRTRADSIMTGIKVADNTGLCVMPHICCRDKNAIAIRAQLLGGYLNGIRNLLVITGDPIPSMMRGDVRSVFNFDSVGLMKIIQEMNEEEFAQDPIVYGGALNHNRRNLEVEIGRLKKKMDAGASFFLTQPSFTREEAERLRIVKEQVPQARILCGIMPLISRKNAVFIRNEMAGIQVTEEIVERYQEGMSREEGEAVGVAIAREMIAMTGDFVDGYYFSIPFNRVYLLDQILK